MYDFLQVLNKDHSSKLLVSFQKIALLCAFWRQTDGRTDNIDALKLSHCREERLNDKTRNLAIAGIFNSMIPLP